VGLVTIKCVKFDECNDSLMLITLTKYPKVVWDPRSNLIQLTSYLLLTLQIHH
jgi:hypothetical protein